MSTVSVLIAAYQAPDWITGCLEAVFAQDLPSGWRLQVLLGIDGCEATLNAVRSLRHEALEVVYAPSNQGTYLMFNSLMQYARGELICRFDADDIMCADYLSTQIQAIEGGADMTLTWSIYTDADLNRIPVYSKRNGLEDADGHCRIGWEGQFVMRRSVWERLRAFRPWRTSADTDFSNRVRAAGFRQVVIQQFLYWRRKHANALTAHPDSNFQSPMRLAVEKLNAEFLLQYQAGVGDLGVEPEYALGHRLLWAGLQSSPA
jgi:glycosyltransferase involved in cell wall biosynthesis